MKETGYIRRGIEKLFLKDRAYEDITPNEYAHFSYPGSIGLMRFDTHLFRVDGFGHLMTMETDTLFGMQLLTCSFMPSEGADVPYLLIDIMLMGKKRMIFAEYYDCTVNKVPQPLLESVHDRYAHLPEHEEKPAWYIKERTGYSLIKDIPQDGDRKLLARVAADSVRAYRRAAFSAFIDENNVSGLLKFRQRMITEGNPSSGVLKKVFGEKGYECYFTSCVMPDGKQMCP